MTSPPTDPSLAGEPHLRGGGPRPDPSERRARKTLRPGRTPSEDEQAEQSVWDEPGLSAELAGKPAPGAVTYAAWLEKRRAGTTAARSWRTVFLVALLSGPWAVLGAFWGSGQTVFSIVILTVFGPVVEETMKLAAASYVTEKKPFLFRSAGQIALCAFASGVCFAALENLLYFNVYIPEPSSRLVVWRWTICVTMHAGCSAIAGLGLIRIWRDTWRRRARPRLTLGAQYLGAAVVIHGSYNGLMLALHVFWFRL